MFYLEIPDDEDTIPNSQLPQKKRKVNTSSSPDLIHSSLGYTSFKAPPIVEYNSIDSYCENSLGKSLLPSQEAASQSTYDISKVSSISSPIVLKSPNQPATNRPPENGDYVPPYSFFSVEELSLVKSLSYWTNTKVCPVGRVEFDVIAQECHLHSVLEKGSWQLLLDTSLLYEIPKLRTVLQIFGCLEVIAERPIIKVHFYRNLGSTDLNLFVSSYRMMQKHIPEFVIVPKSPNERISNESTQVKGTEIGCELNDTLDGYNLSVVEKCIDPEVENKQDHQS